MDTRGNYLENNRGINEFLPLVRKYFADDRFSGSSDKKSIPDFVQRTVVST